MGEARLKRQQADPQQHLDEADAAYFARVLEQVQYAQRLDQEAVQFEQQAAERRQHANRLYGAHESLVNHLCLKYGLDPKADRIDAATGQIIRPAQVELAAASPTVNGTD
jgi:hypothetical protein